MKEQHQKKTEYTTVESFPSLDWEVNWARSDFAPLLHKAPGLGAQKRDLNTHTLSIEGDICQMEVVGPFIQHKASK